MAQAWIPSSPQQFQARQECTFAVILKQTSELISAVSLTLTMAHRRGELGCSIRRTVESHGDCAFAPAAPSAPPTSGQSLLTQSHRLPYDSGG